MLRELLNDKKLTVIGYEKNLREHNLEITFPLITIA
jgi:hypothetical protein